MRLLEAWHIVAITLSPRILPLGHDSKGRGERGRGESG